MAIHFYSGEIAKQMGLKHEDVKADWNAAVLPNVAHAPSVWWRATVRWRAVARTSSPAKLATAKDRARREGGSSPAPGNIRWPRLVRGAKGLHAKKT